MKKYFLFFLISVLMYSNLVSQNNSVLSSGEWYRITTNQDGIHRIDYADLETLGVSLNNLQISSVKIYGNGGGMLSNLNSEFRYIDLIENSILVKDYNSNGFFDNDDYILFYGTSAHVWKFNQNTNLYEHQMHLFADEVSYFLTVDNHSVGKRILEKSIEGNPTKFINSYNMFANH